MQAASKNVGKKTGAGFKCPSFSAPVKPNINQPSQSSSPDKQLVLTPTKLGPSGDINSKNTGNTTEEIKPTIQGDSCSNTDHDGISSVSTSKQGKSHEPSSSETSNKEPSMPKKVVKKKAKFTMKPNTTGSPKSSQKVKLKKVKEDENVTDPFGKKTKTLKRDNKKSESDKNEKKILPVKSLSDVEYDAIFAAVLENAMNLDMEEWQPKVTSPHKVKVPVKKKYSVTVGKKAKPDINEKKKKNSVDNELLNDVQEEPESPASENKTNVDNVHSDDDKEHAIDVGLDDDGTESAKDDADSVVGENQPDVENNDVGDAVVDHAVANADAAYNVDNDAIDNDDDIPNVLEVEGMESIAQGENEVTPAASVADETDKLTVNVATPIKKKKKILKAKKKLEPKHLPFSDCKEPSMVDKVCKMKQLKKKKEETTSKKTRNIYCTKSMALPKQPVKSSQKKISRKRKMQQRELDTKDTEHNSCDKPEEDYDENEHIFTKFTEGSVVWAKMSGYPWWPAMVEIDPDTETYFSIDSDDSMFPTHYHVVFFDDHVSRVWVKSGLIKQFTGDEENDGVVVQGPKKKHTALIKEVVKAKKNAVRSLKCTLKERIELFGFAVRYKGRWSSNKKAKGKKSKIGTKQSGHVDETEFLDDSTVDDILVNTESLLDNVEEMLNSLDSQLDGSDKDSDFVPDRRVGVGKKSKKNSMIGVRFVEDKDSDTNDSIEDSETKITNKAGLDLNPVFDEHSDINHTDSSDVKYPVGKGDSTDEKSKTEKRKELKKKQVDKSEITNRFKEVSTEHKHETKAGGKKRKIKDQNEEHQQNVDEKKKEVEKCTKDFDVPKVNKLEKEIVEDNNITDDVAPKIDDEKDKTDHESDEFDILAADDVEINLKSVENEILDKETKDNNENDDNAEDERCDELELFGITQGDGVNTLKSAEQSLDEDVGDDFDLEDQSMYETVTDGSSKIRELSLQNDNVHASSEVEEYSDPFDLMEE